MATFAPRLASQQVDRVARLQAMMDMPFTLTRNLGEQALQGVIDSYGLGATIRDIAIPAGNTTRVNPVAMMPGLPGAIAGGYEAGRTLINSMRPDQPSLNEAEYKASPYFRSDIPFEQGMTEDRAAALAMFYDTKKVREYFGEKRPFSTFIGQFAGQALDPINYVPVFGQAAEAAAVARIGTVAGRAVIGAADGAINTAAFGFLTAGLRDQFGDDTSWQAMTSEIAMSALIGGAFGGVSGVITNAVAARRGRFDRQLEAAVADALTDMRGVKESRAVLNEAIGDMAAGRDVNLSPNGQAAVERIQTAATKTASTARALDEQTANIPDGAKVAITPAGSRVEVRPEVVELDSLVNASGALQVRNRSSQASAAQVEQIATSLDPARLMTSVDADSGAPIVGGDNVVDSGNGRIMAIRRASEAYPDRYGAYRKSLEDAGYDLTGMEKPVLISRRVTALSDDARARFNAEANAPRAAQMSAVELAAMDRNALDGTLDVLDASPITSAANRAFVQRFLGNLVPSARGALVDPSGAINADGVRRVENALVAQAYGDVDVGVLRRFAEATDDNTRSIVGAMSDVAGKWAAMRQMIKAGDISPEFDMTRELTDALRMIGQWREQAARESRPVSIVIREGMAQLDLLSGEVSPETQAIISAFYTSNSFARAAGRETIADFLGRIADAAEELGRPQLFGEAGVGRMEVLRNAAVNEQGNLFTPVGTVDGIEADGGFDRTTPVSANRQSAGSGDGQGRRVADTVSQRLAAAGRPEAEAQALGQIVDAFYAQQAARLGMTVDEFVDRFGIPEVRQGDTMPDEALAQGEAAPNMIVQHNLSAANLLHADKMRGLAVPSLAISNVDYPLDGFGEITLIGGPSLIDPKADSASKVFDADVYSPRYPTVRYKVASKPYDKAWKRMDKASADLGHVLSGEIDHSEVERKGLEAFRDSSAVQLQFLRETGRDVELPQMTARTSYVAKVPEIADLVGQYDTPAEVMKKPDAVAAIGRALDMEIATVLDARGEGFTADEVRGWYYDKDGDIRRTVIDAIQQEIKIGKSPGVDRSAARQALRDAVKPYADEFAAWVDEQFSPVLASETIETQTANGDWKYMPHTLDNVVKVLRRKLRDGEGFNYGVASIRSNVANQFKSVAAIKKARGKLIPADAMAALKDETNDEFVALANVMEGYSKNKLGFGFLDAFSDHVKEVAERGVRALDQYYDGLPDAQKQAVVDFLDKLANMPTEYFEAKLQRAVDISEFKAAVIPNTADKATRDVLTYARVPVIEYDPKVPNSRAAAMREAAGERDLLFQGGDNPRGAIQLGDTDIITLFETADASTALHETGHLFLSMLKGIGEVADAPAEVRADWDAVRNWWGENADAVAADANASGRAADVTADDVRAALATGSSGDAAKDRAIDVGMQEQWARGFEAYVREGKAPTAGLARAFDQFKQWLQAIYRRAADLNVNLSDDIRQVFDNLLAEPKPRAEVKIDGKAVRVRDMPANDDGPKAPEPVTAQKSLLLNEPANAAARVGKDDTLRDIALSHGVDPATGSFVEAGDIAQLREEGRLTADDEAVLADADQMFADAEAYGRALDAAVACLV